MEASHPDYGTSMWYNSAMYQEPDAPHDTIQSTDGVGWYAMQPHNDIPQFEPPTEDAKAYNQAQFQSFMPGYEAQPTYVDTCRARDGIIDLRHADGSAMRFYDHTQFQAPRGDYTVYEDKRGGQWYVRVHEGTKKPVGSLADHRLRKLRKEAHDSFNKLYLTGAMTKDQAYAWLAHMIQGPRSQAHIGYLREYYCEQVIQQSKAILANRKEAQQAVSQTRRQLRAGGETV